MEPLDAAWSVALVAEVLVSGGGGEDASWDTVVLTSLGILVVLTLLAVVLLVAVRLVSLSESVVGKSLVKVVVKPSDITMAGGAMATPAPFVAAGGWASVATVAVSMTLRNVEVSVSLGNFEITSLGRAMSLDSVVFMTSLSGIMPMWSGDVGGAVSCVISEVVVLSVTEEGVVKSATGVSYASVSFVAVK